MHGMASKEALVGEQGRFGLCLGLGSSGNRSRGTLPTAPDEDPNEQGKARPAEGEEAAKPRNLKRREHGRGRRWSRGKCVRW